MEKGAAGGRTNVQSSETGACTYVGEGGTKGKGGKWASAYEYRQDFHKKLGGQVIWEESPGGKTY